MVLVHCYCCCCDLDVSNQCTNYKHASMNNHKSNRQAAGASSLKICFLKSMAQNEKNACSRAQQYIMQSIILPHSHMGVQTVKSKSKSIISDSTFAERMICGKTKSKACASLQSRHVEKIKDKDPPFQWQLMQQTKVQQSVSLLQGNTLQSFIVPTLMKQHEVTKPSFKFRNHN